MPACLPLTSQMIQPSLARLVQHLCQRKHRCPCQPVDLGRHPPLIINYLKEATLPGAVKYGTSEMRAFTEPAGAKDQVVRT